MTSRAGVLIVVVVLPGKLLHYIVEPQYSQYEWDVLWRWSPEILLDPFIKNQNGNRYILVAEDQFTK